MKRNLNLTLTIATSLIAIVSFNYSCTTKVVYVPTPAGISYNNPDPALKKEPVYDIPVEDKLFYSDITGNTYRVDNEMFVCWDYQDDLISVYCSSDELGKEAFGSEKRCLEVVGEAMNQWGQILEEGVEDGTIGEDCFYAVVERTIVEELYTIDYVLFVNSWIKCVEDTAAKMKREEERKWYGRSDSY